MRTAVAGVLLVVDIAIGWGRYGDTSSPLSFTSDPGAKPVGLAPGVLMPAGDLTIRLCVERLRQRRHREHR